MKYNLGLDIGTDSIGWALVDENNKIVKKNGFTFWGVRMFEASKSSQERRLFRGSRRRIQRRKERITLLQNIFLNEINKVDKSFFQRLNDSFFKIEDKKLNNKHTLFDDQLTDKEYFERFPTIYHLREYYLKHDEKMDIRMLYLALHHMIKYRGNFLKEGDEFNQNDSSQINEKIDEINNMLYEANEMFEDEDVFFARINIKENFFTDLKSILLSNERKNDKKIKLLSLFNVEKKSFVNEFIIPLLLGSKVNVSSLSLVKDEKYEKTEIISDSEEFESMVENAKSVVKELASILDIAIIVKEIYDYYFLLELIGDNKYLSESMVAKYNKHAEDLTTLKKLVKTYCPVNYNSIFRTVDEKLNNYPKYIGMNSTNGNVKRFSHCTITDFYTYIKKVLDKISCEENIDIINNIKFEMEKEMFLPRLNSGHNTSIPMQLNLIELRKILSIQSKYYPFLNEVSDEYTNSKKIEMIFKYHIPYYVGPLNRSSDRSWFIRNDEYKNEKITPWNFDKVVDLNSSAKEFIQRMQNKCTYLKGADDYCLPKKSMIFSEYNCYSYLNKLQINNRLIDVDIKMELFENVFLKKKKPTKKDIVSYLTSNKNYKEEDIKSKIDEIQCDMSSYIKFKEIFKDDFESKYNMIEEIIKDITIFEDKKILEKRLINIYKLDNEKVKQIKDLNYKGYGRLSRRLLVGLKSKNTNQSILDIMRETNQNLMEILADYNYKFQEVIDEYNKSVLVNNDQSAEEYITNNLYVSADSTRALIQTYKLIEEIEQITKTKIDSYYIECTRSNQAKKKATVSRGNKIKNIYSKIINSEIASYNIDLKTINDKLDQNILALRGEKLYLYFMQLGKCLYTMETIDITKLDNYDIDHIYPQSLIKDDSFSNRVLVNKKFNQDTKKDKFLFEIRNKINKQAYPFYKLLLEKELITKEKYKRLTESELSDDTLNGFINRQLVSTNQAVTGLISLLKDYKQVDSSKIIYSKAENISDFRQTFDFVKSRDANNYHHAHDAYLNVVVGKAIDNYYKYHHVYFYKDKEEMKEKKYTINPITILKRDRIYNRNGEEVVIWKKDETIKLLNHYIKETFNISETLRTYEGSTMYGKTTVLPASDTLVPVSQTDARVDVARYGGITSNAYPKYVITEVKDKKGKIQYILEPIPYIEKNNIDEYLKKIYDKKYTDIKIVHPLIKSNILVSHNKNMYYITGKTGDSYSIKNALDRRFDYKSIKLLKIISKYNDNIKNEIEMLESETSIIVSVNKDGEVTHSISTNEVDYLLNQIIIIYSKDIYDYSNVKNIINLVNEKKDSLTLKEKITLVTQLINILKTNSRTLIDLSVISGSKNSGILVINKKLQPGMKFIATSITGYYKKVLFEVPNVI